MEKERSRQDEKFSFGHHRQLGNEESDAGIPSCGDSSSWYLEDSSRVELTTYKGPVAGGKGLWYLKNRTFARTCNNDGTHWADLQTCPILGSRHCSRNLNPSKATDEALVVSALCESIVFCFGKISSTLPVTGRITFSRVGIQGCIEGDFTIDAQKRNR